MFSHNSKFYIDIFAPIGGSTELLHFNA